MIEKVHQMAASLHDILSSKEARLSAVRIACQGMLFNEALTSLAAIDVDELSRSKAGIRVLALKEAGFNNLKDVAQASDRELAAVPGVGAKQVESIRSIVSDFQNQLAEYSNLKIKPDDFSPENIALLISIYQFIHSNEMLEKGSALDQYSNYFQSFNTELFNRNIARGSMQWLFSGKKKKLLTSETMEWLSETIYGPAFRHAQEAVNEYTLMMNRDPRVIMDEFKKNSAPYYATLELAGDYADIKPLVYSSIPAKMAGEIDSLELDLSEFNGILRSYQAFGAKYILRQGRVLLGDEMGLGKTIEAIAAMAHIYAVKKKIVEEEGLDGAGSKSYFLVVCPAGVLVNWVREVKKFCNIPVHLVHGAYKEEELAKWKDEGGICVTNYETMGKIIGDIDNKMELEMMVVDEAHYIKNPDAKRSKYVYALENESTVILLMTGTPLENKVDEMCTLIDFIRPDMSEAVRNAAGMRQAPEFREMIAPVYLRRRREDVLSELPGIEHKEEWCSMTHEDSVMYVEALLAHNFNDMRRVGFLQSDMLSSSKASRIQEICEEAMADGRKIIVFSFFRETVDKIAGMLGEDCIGVITGSTEPTRRQAIIDEFTDSEDEKVLVAQIQAGGTGLNIQAASIVIFAEPQIKPSLESQALSRVYRMGQTRNVLVYHMLCPNTVDEAVAEIFNRKQGEFDLYAHESVMGSAGDNIIDNAWIKDYIDKATKKLELPEKTGEISANEIMLGD